MLPRKAKTKQDRIPRNDEEQSRLFIEAAREHGADEESSKADEVIGRLAKRPPEPRKKPKTEK